MMGHLMEQRNVFKIPAYCNYNKCNKVYASYARTILARDYKGFGTSDETTNAVIEYK